MLFDDTSSDATGSKQDNSNELASSDSDRPLVSKKVEDSSERKVKVPAIRKIEGTTIVAREITPNTVVVNNDKKDITQVSKDASFKMSKLDERSEMESRDSLSVREISEPSPKPQPKTVEVFKPRVVEYDTTNITIKKPKTEELQVEQTTAIKFNAFDPYNRQPAAKPTSPSKISSPIKPPPPHKKLKTPAKAVVESEESEEIIESSHQRTQTLESQNSHKPFTIRNKGMLIFITSQIVTLPDFLSNNC